MNPYIRSCASILIVTFMVSSVNLPSAASIATVAAAPVPTTVIAAPATPPTPAASDGNSNAETVTATAPDNNTDPASSTAPSGTTALPSPVVAAPAASTVSSTVTPQKNTETFPLYDNDRGFQGGNSREDYFFEIVKSRKVLPGSYVDIYYSHSPMLLPQSSTLTFLIDDIPISSVLLNENNKDKTLLRIDISKYLTKPGYHKLSFLADMQFANNICMDPNNPANWLVIHKESTFHLNMDKNYSNADLTWYPSPFFERGSQQPLQSIIVVPDQIEQAEFSAAARLVQFFSTQVQYTRIHIPIYAESDLTADMLANNHTLWLGRTGHWKERGKLLEDTLRKQAEPAIQGQGILAVGNSPWNAQLSSMLISGANEELTNAAAILTEETLYTQLFGKAAAIPATLKKIEPPIAVNQGNPTAISFEKMGYNNHITIGGKVEGNTTINYNLPTYLDIEDEARLTIAFKHSKAIDYARSVISVKLNGIPVDSHKLSEATSDAGLIEVTLTPDVIGTNRSLAIEISFRFAANTNTGTNTNANGNANTNVNQLEECIEPNLIGNWAVIDKASTISYNSVDRKNFNLQSIPYSFIKNGRWNDTIFLFPEQLGSKELNAAMTLIGILGRNVVDTANLTFTQTSATGLKDLLRGRNIIYLGTAKDLPDFMNGFPDSSVEFKDNKMISLTKNIELLSDLQSRSAVIQLSHSPLNEEKTLLMLAATSPDRLGSITKALTDPIDNSKITGKFVVIDHLNNIHAFPEPPVPIKPAAKAKPNPVAEFLNGQNKMAVGGDIFVLVFGVMLLVIGGTVWLARRRR
jgi:hypothetical protein